MKIVLLKENDDKSNPRQFWLTLNTGITIKYMYLYVNKLYTNFYTVIK